MNQLQGTVLGIEAQTLLDSFLLILTGNTKYSHRGQYRPAHCKNIVFYSTWDSSLELGTSYSCRPADPDKYPDWACYYRDPSNDELTSVAPSDHGYCGRQNIPCSRVYWCTCAKGLTLVSALSQNSGAVEYFIPSSGSETLCEGCRNDHGNEVVCDNCGQVH